MAVSRYAYLRRPARPGQQFGKARDLALSLEFSDFIVQVVRRWGRFPFEAPLHRYYHLNGQVPSNFKMILMENLVDGVNSALQEIGVTSDGQFPWLNASKHNDFASYYDQRSEETIYSQARWVFDQGLYPRLELKERSDQVATDRTARRQANFSSGGGGINEPALGG
jgi:hypothetical protein